VGRVDLGWRNGKRLRKAVYGRTRKAVADRLPKLLQAAQDGTTIPNERQTVAQFLERWLEHKRTRMRSRAWLTYEQTVRLHLVPGIGKIALGRLKSADIERWFDEHQSAGTGTRTIRYARTVLRAALNQARKWELVTSNAAALVEPPRHTAKQIRPLTPEQARELLAAAKGHRLGALVSVSTAVGLRIGEALGLRWADVDLDAGTLSVTQAIERSGGDPIGRRSMLAASREIRQRITAAPQRSRERRQLRADLEKLRKEWRQVRSTLRVTEPKSVRSRRTVRLPGVVLTALRAHRTRQLEDRLAAGGAWEDSGLVFTSPIGSALDPRNATRAFKALLTDAELPNIRFHDLRHTAATLLLAQGVDPRTIMETLGHSQISLTMNTYSHVLPALQADAAARLDAVLTR
jgi:integrase